MKIYYVSKTQIDNIREILNNLVSAIESFHIQLNILESEQELMDVEEKKK